MISLSMDTNELCKKLVGKSRSEIIELLKQEANAADRKNRSNKGKDSRERVSIYRAYIGLIEKLLNRLAYDGGAFLDEKESKLTDPIFKYLKEVDN